MKFIFKNNGSAINVAFVKSINIGKVVYEDENNYDEKFCVAVVLSDDTNEIISREFDTDGEAEKYFAELVENLNEDGVKFLLNHLGNMAINFAFVKSISIESVIYKNGEGEVHVAAEYPDESDVVLKIFDLENADENSKAAEKYLSKLIKKLNGGGAK